MLHVSNPTPAWWGEGDEKFFVDGEKFRTLRGATIAADFKALVIDYIEQRYGGAGAKAPAVTAAE